LAIFHCDVKLVQRSAGSSAVATSAYIAGEKIQDDRCDKLFDYSKKQGVVHSEIMAPKQAPDWAKDRGALWNQVEASENRKDSQLARHIIVALPKELPLQQQVELTQQYVQDNFVKAGMVADFSIHHDKPTNPHAHILLTTRDISEQGFGAKNREWNLKAQIYSWRENWAKEVNQSLLRAGIEASVSEKSLKDRGIDLLPNIHLGAAAHHQYEKGDTGLDRVAEYERTCTENGNRIIADPRIGLSVLLDSKSTFDEKDMAWVATKNSMNLTQYNSVYQAMRSHPSVVEIGQNDKSETVFTVKSILDKETQLIESVHELARNSGHGVCSERLQALPQYGELNEGQQTAVDFITSEGDVKCVVGFAGTGKSFMLKVAREAWEQSGYEVKGMCLAGKAAEELYHSADIKSETIDYYVTKMKHGKEVFSKNDILVVDEANMAGLNKMMPILNEAARVGAKVVMVGDGEQLLPVKDTPVFQYVAMLSGHVVLDQVRRQENENHKAATVLFGNGQAAKAIAIYEKEGAIQFQPDRGTSIEAVAQHWIQDKSEDKLMLGFMRDDVLKLNLLARAQLIKEGKLEEGKAYQTHSGERLFSVGEKIVFGAGDKQLGIKNGTRAEIVTLDNQNLVVKLAGEKRDVVIDTNQYNKIDYAYATTIHKAEGMTVDSCYVLMTHHCRSNEANVTMTRHRHEMKCVVDASSLRNMQTVSRHVSEKREMRLAIEHATLHGLKPTLQQAAEVAREKQAAHQVQAVMRQDLNFIKAYTGDKGVRHAFKNERVIGVAQGAFETQRNGSFNLIKTQNGTVLVPHDPALQSLKGALVDLQVRQDKIELGHVMRQEAVTQKFIDVKAPKMQFKLPEQFSGKVLDRLEVKEKSYLRVLSTDQKLYCVPEREGMEKLMGKQVEIKSEPKGRHISVDHNHHVASKNSVTTHEIERS
jgi:Ti-type conjugative transfer relaxase TraA